MARVIYKTHNSTRDAKVYAKDDTQAHLSERQHSSQNDVRARLKALSDIDLAQAWHVQMRNQDYTTANAVLDEMRTRVSEAQYPDFPYPGWRK